MYPFRIAPGVMEYAQNLFIRIHTSAGLYGVGECSAFPMITGETQSTCYVMAQDMARLWIGKEASDIDGCMRILHAFTAYNATVKSAFDMALYDLAAKRAGVPLCEYLGGQTKPMETDLTIGLNTAGIMGDQAREFITRGVNMLKVKLGTSPEEDIERIREVRAAAGHDVKIRIDANQGWSFDDAVSALTGLEQFDIQFCEQPMRRYDDAKLPVLRSLTSIPIMADESVFDHHDAKRIIEADACDYVNIKFAKSSGIREAIRINEICEANNIPCMMGGMLESRVALTAFAHFAAATPNIIFYDMDTCMLGHKEDPVTGGVTFDGFMVNLPAAPGIGADVEESYLEKLVSVRIS
jgi:L-alanine-DL-glutamate epimerase-like enolase superfamily enzyme